jgi:hypothetical protein
MKLILCLHCPVLSALFCGQNYYISVKVSLLINVRQGGEIQIVETVQNVCMLDLLGLEYYFLTTLHKGPLCNLALFGPSKVHAPVDPIFSSSLSLFLTPITILLEGVVTLVI